LALDLKEVYADVEWSISTDTIKCIDDVEFEDIDADTSTEVRNQSSIHIHVTNPLPKK
jgi:hypothetical protein